MKATIVTTMDRSARRLPDPVAAAPNGERRRSVRQKLHSPVYASFKGPQTGMVVDLSELLDLHEEGFAVQTSERLEPNRAVTLCLDLPETKSYIHGSGQVIWSDDSGRGRRRSLFCAGGRFPAHPERMAVCQPADRLREPRRSQRATGAAGGRKIPRAGAGS